MTPLFSPSGYIGVYNERLAIVLGMITLVSALAIFASCRQFITLFTRLGWKNLVEAGAYRSFYRYHSYYWWGFWFVFVLHALTGIMHTGLNTTTDPDAYLHLYVLWSGLGAFLTVLVVFSSCRSPVNFIDLFRSKTVLTLNGYRFFYRYHSYYWLVFILLVAAHFVVGYIHTGIWPQ